MTLYVHWGGAWHQATFLHHLHAHLSQFFVYCFTSSKTMKGKAASYILLLSNLVPKIKRPKMEGKVG